MPILFSAVACDRHVLAKYASCDGNFSEIADELLLRIPDRNDKRTYSHGHYLFHYINENDTFYFCITDKTCQRSRAFLFLNQIKRRYSPKQRDFSDVLADEMYRYSEDYSTITVMKGELDELNRIGVGTSDEILGEKILFVNNPDNRQYRTVRQLEDPIQIPSVTQATEIDTKQDCSKDLTEKESPKHSSKFFYYVILAGILIVLWLVISMMGPVSFVAVGFICGVSIAKFPKGKHEM